MKVLHVIPSLGPLRGGPSFALPRMAQGLAQAGVNVHVVATDDNGSGHLDVPLGQFTLQNGIPTIFFRRQTQIYTGSLPLAHWLWRHTKDYDLLHIHSLFSHSSTAAGFCARRSKVPYIVRPLGHLNRWGMTGRRRWIKRVSLSLLEHRLLAGAALIHYTGDHEKQEAQESGINFPSFVLPLGIEHKILQEKIDYSPFLEHYPNLKDRFIVLFLSRLHPIKGLDLLLSAFAGLHHQHPQTALVLAGTGDEAFLDELQLQINKLGLNDVVIQTGFIDGKDKLMAFHAADVFVLPSYSESFANAPVEALAAGLPVVVSDQVGVADIIHQADAGLVVPCRVQELQDALVSLFKDMELRRKMRSTGLELAESKFSLEVTTKALIEKYKSVLR